MPETSLISKREEVKDIKVVQLSLLVIVLEPVGVVVRCLYMGAMYNIPTKSQSFDRLLS